MKNKILKIVQQSNVSHKEIDKAFKQLISLYDACDDLENSAYTIEDGKKAKKMRATLNKLGEFIQSLKN
jgi:type II secretory pathway component PulF